jgi:hypothetical protein
MKDTYYFSHDYNSRQDEKIKRLIMKHGLLGYGIFWAIVEDLYNNANALQMDYERIAFELRVDETIIKSIINDFKLFVFNEDTFGSLSVEKRLNQRNEKSNKARNSANKRWEKSNNDANALQTQSDSNAIKEIKIKEIKSKEIKIKENKINIKEFVFLSESELNKLNEEFASHEVEWMLNKLNDYKASTGKKYKSDYAAINMWVKDAFRKAKVDFIKDNNTSEVRVATAMKAIENINWDDYTKQR